MYHLDDDHRYLMVMGVGPEGADGAYQSFQPFQCVEVNTFGLVVGSPSNTTTTC